MLFGFGLYNLFGRGSSAGEKLEHRRCDISRAVAFFQKPFHRGRGEISSFEDFTDLIKGSLQAALLDLIGRGKFAALDFGAGESLEMLDFINVPPSHKSHRHPLAAGASRPADAVHIVFGVVGQVVIHDEFEVIHIDAARRDIRGHEKFKLRLLEFVHHTRALGLGQAAVQPVR